MAALFQNYRAHQQNIVPVIDAALRKANIDKEQLSAIAFTQGPD
jgi:N6-L-threonylcarbamoyladenine synthase